MPVVTVEANHMTKGMNWRRAASKDRPAVSMIDDERERGKDVAARWLARHDDAKRRKRRRKKARGTKS